MERLHFSRTTEYHSDQHLVETAYSFAAVELLFLALLRIAGSEFPLWTFGQQQFWRIQWVLVCALVLLSLVVPALGKWRTPAYLALLAAQSAWIFFYGRAHLAELKPGFVGMANAYLNAWNHYYHTNYMGWNVKGGNISGSFAFAVIVLTLLFLILRYLTGVRLFLLVPPSAMLVTGILVDVLPDWQALSYLFAGVIVLYSGSRSPARVTFDVSEQGKKPTLWMQFTNLFQVLILAGAVVLFTGAWFADSAAKIPDHTEKLFAFQKNLEEQIKNLGNVQVMSNRAHVDNQTPDYQDKLVLSINASSEPQSNLYLPEFYSGTYRGGSWVQDTKTYQKAAAADGFDGDRLGMLLRQSVIEHIRQNVETDDFVKMTDYTITYHANTSRAMLPYFSDVSSAGSNVWVTDEGTVRKKRFADSVAFSGLTRNVMLDIYDVAYETMDYYVRVEDNDADRWYSDYVKAHYVNGADLPAVKAFAADAFSELSIFGERWVPLVSADYDKEQDVFSVQKTVAGKRAELWQTYSVRDIYPFYADGLIDQLAAENLYYRGADDYDTNKYRLAMAYAVRLRIAERAQYNLYLDQIPDQTDTIEYFLETGHEGYCMHFASAGTLTLQEMGIPARYASGYVAKRDSFAFDKKTGVYTADVYDRNAHAWVEIYLEGIGWVPFEMTPGYTSVEAGLPTDADKQQQLQQEHQNKETPADSEAGVQNEPESQTEADTQNETESQTETDTQADTEKNTQNAAQQNPAGGQASSFGGVGNGGRIVKILGIIAAAVLVLFLIVFATGRAMRYYWELLWQELNRKQYRCAVRRINRRIYRRLQKGGVLQRGMTDAEYEQRLVKAYPSISSEDWKYYMEIVKKAAFSREEISREEAAHCYHIYRKHRESTKRR